MFRKCIVMIMLMASVSAMANSMSKDISEKAFKVPADTSESRRHYEKQGRVTYVAQAPAAETTAAQTSETAEQTKQPAKLTTPAKAARPSKRSGGMRY